MRKSILLILCCLLSTVLYAGPVSKEQARQIASQFLTAKGGARRAPAQLVEQPPVLNAVDKAGNPYIYAFNAGHDAGYVLVSGDDRFRDVLAYGASGNFDNDDMPAHVKAWLQGYVDEMQYYESVGYQPTASTTDAKVRRAIKSAISPLLVTAWGQGKPYNNNCPEFVTTSKPRCVTGCVATAMAQLMYYNAQRSGGLPAATTTEIAGYTCARKWKVNLIDKQVSVSAIPAGTALHWNNMLASYPSGYTDAQADAVATLMQCCGASVQMDYADADNGGSGAALADVAPALKTYFGYDESTTYAERANYTLNQWVDKVYAELAVARPVLYGGQSSGGGHAFVIDGYDGDEMFHVNWGWNGSPDSYYALSVLNPDDNSGIGASTSNDGYSYGQEAVFHATIGSTDEPEETPQMMTTSVFTLEDATTIRMECGNTTDTERTYDFGIGSIDAEGNITALAGGTSTVPSGYGFYGDNYKLTFNITEYNLDDGTYKIIPIGKLHDASKWLTDVNTDIWYVEAVVTGGNVTLTAHPAAVLTAMDITFTGSKYKGEAQPVDVTVSNSGDEFYGVLYLFASKNDTKGDPVTKGGVTVQKNKSTTMTFEWTPESTGSYNIWITTDEEGNNVIGKLTGEDKVSIMTKPSEPGDPSLAGKDVAIMSCTYENQDDASYSVDANGIRSIDILDNNIKATAVVKNLSSSSVSYVGFKLYKWNEDNSAYEPLDGNYSWYTNAMSSGATWQVSHIEENLDYGKYNLKLVKVTLNSDQTAILSTEVLDDRYTCNLAMSYSATNENGEKVRVKTTDPVVTVANDVAAIDLTKIPYTSVTPNKNPNTLYIIGSEQTVPESLNGKNVVKGGVAEQITLTDGHAFYSPVDFTAKNISYTRKESTYYDKDTQKGWTTLVLPFAPAGIKTYVGETKYDLTWFTGASETDKNLWLMKFDDEHGGTVDFGYASSILEANKPYIMALPGDSYGNKWSLKDLSIIFYAEDADIKANAKATTVGTNYKFVGTTLSKTNLTDIYKLNADGDQFVLGTTASIEPFRAYFAPTSTAATATELSIGFGRNVITNVLELKGVTEVKDADNNSIYNMNGQRVAQPTRGLYIVNGKKVVIK